MAATADFASTMVGDGSTENSISPWLEMILSVLSRRRNSVSNAHAVFSPTDSKGMMGFMVEFVIDMFWNIYLLYISHAM